MTRVADTSVLYALFDEDDAFHDDAKEDVSLLEPILIPTEILVETVDLLSYRFGPKAGVKALKYLLDLPHAGIADRMEVGAVQRIYEGSQGALSLADAFVVQTCVGLGTVPLAYDRGIVDVFKQRPS